MLHAAWQNFIRASTSAAAGPAEATEPRGFAYVPDLRVAEFVGSDVRRFLQGYLTCDVLALPGDRFQAAAVCNLKGRVVVNGWVTAADAERVRFVVHASLLDGLESMLRVYLRFSRTRLVDRRDDCLVFAGWGADAPGMPIDARRRLLLAEDLAAAEAVWANQPHRSAAAWDDELIMAGLPLVSAPTSDQFLPQMLDLPALGAVDFAKGCYLGQEIVARAQHRGQVKRHLTRLQWRGPARPAPGDTLVDAAGRSRAIVLQSAVRGDAAASAGVALAVVQDESTYPLDCAGTAFTPLD